MKISGLSFLRRSGRISPRLLRIYRAIWGVKPPLPPQLAYTPFGLVQTKHLTAFVDKWCFNIALMVVKTGTSVPVTELTLKRRGELNLPIQEFDKGELRELSRVTGLLKVLGEEQ